MQKTAIQVSPAVALLVERGRRHCLKGFTLIQTAIVLMLSGVAASSAFTAKELVATYRIHAQVSQIIAFDQAVVDFHGKYEGLPGDLLNIMAQREGLPSGDGTPGHSDGDGNISPCNPGWQSHLGCETALFWSQLFMSDMIPGSFSADNVFIDKRLSHVGAMEPYLPRSPMGEGIFIAVWNSNASQPSPKPRLLYGNYYEISRIQGVQSERMVDDANALTVAEARAIDAKLDDGLPLSGRVVVNGEANWPKDAWGSYAKPNAVGCVLPNRTYNVWRGGNEEAPLCHLAIRFASNSSSRND